MQAPTPLGGQDANRFLEALLAHIQRFRHYPNEAEWAGAQGTVWLRFQMDRQGHVLAAWIEQSSGQRVLDAEAIATVHRAEPLPTIPAGLPDQIDITVPVPFTLS